MFSSFKILRRTSIALALQFSTSRSSETIVTLRRLQSAEYKELNKYMAEFYATLLEEILGDPDFAFIVWLIPKPANEAKRSDYSIEYIKLDETNRDQIANFISLIVAIKSKNTLFDPSKECNMWGKEVVEELKNG